MGITNSTKLELDHHVAYLCHVELARLLVKLGPAHFDDARQHLSMVLEAKIPFGPSKGKGKVSMQNAFVMKANGIRKSETMNGFVLTSHYYCIYSTTADDIFVQYTVEQLNAQTKH